MVWYFPWMSFLSLTRRDHSQRFNHLLVFLYAKRVDTTCVMVYSFCKIPSISRPRILDYRVKTLHKRWVYCEIDTYCSAWGFFPISGITVMEEYSMRNLLSKVAMLFGEKITHKGLTDVCFLRQHKYTNLELQADILGFTLTVFGLCLIPSFSCQP